MHEPAVAVPDPGSDHAPCSGPAPTDATHGVAAGSPYHDHRPPDHLLSASAFAPVPSPLGRTSLN